MDSSIKKRISEFMGEKNKHRHWRIVVTALAMVVIVTTAYILSKPAQTLVNDVYCGMEEHVHTEECYSLVCVCGEADLLTEGEDNAQGLGEASGDAAGLENPASGQEAPAAGLENPASGQEAPAAGSENPVPEQEAPAAGLENPASGQEAAATEAEIHHHDETCYAEEKQLICGREEVPGHVHTDACKTITESRELTCGQEESTGHTHTDECKRIVEEKTLVCGLEENEEHTHADGCYTVSQREELVCGLEEQNGHSHTDDCYTVSQKEELVCGLEEQDGHSHTDECYEVVKKLVCGKEEAAPTESAAPENPGQTPAEPAAPENPGQTPAEPVAPENPDQAPAENIDNEKASEESAHVHTEECYERKLTCKAEEHTHDDSCYREVFCGIKGHTHGVSCYDEEGELLCEIPEHRHEDNCYKEPHCGITVHIHDEDCYDETGALVCEMEEHIHADECYITNTYYCKEQIHVHTNDCYDLDGNLCCGRADYWVHSHTEACYDKNERLICTLPEREEGEILHTHTESCYGVRGVLICGQTEVLRHDHDETCRIEPDGAWIDTTGVIAYCGRPAHNHRDVCRDGEGNIICGVEEHTHTDGCFEEPGYGCIAQIHIHEADCYDKDGNIQCGLADYVLHTHGPLCYGIGGKLLCTLEERAFHIHSAECYSQETAGAVEPAEGGETAEAAEAGESAENAESAGAAEAEEPADHAEGQEAPAAGLTCGLSEADPHQHTAACRDESGLLICGGIQETVHIHTADCVIDAANIEITQSVKGADFIITATYNKKAANLPDDARLFAERITPEDNEEYYAQRAAQYQEMQGEKDENTMQALLRIGFTVGGEEVEPEAPVTVTVQLLDENGMAEGSPVTVVHFGEEGTERIEGTNAEKNSTTFQMNSFSEIALGWKDPVKTVVVDKTVTYEDDAFTVKFHVEGEAVLPTEKEIEEVRKTQAEGNDVDTEQTEIPAHDGEGIVTSENLEFEVKALDEESAEYAAVMTYAEETDTQEGMLALQVLSYALTYEGIKLDLTDCVVTAELMPTQALVEFIEQSADSMMMTAEEDIEEDAPEFKNEAVMAAMSFSEEEGEVQIDDVLGTMEVSDEAEEDSFQVTVEAEGTDGFMAVSATSAWNPKFTVQYYAKLDILNKTGANALPLIDTSGKKLPKNGNGTENSPNGNPIKNIYVDNAGNVLTTETLTEVYASRKYEYIAAPTIKYFNALLEKPAYELKEIWVLKKGKEATSIKRDDWDIYQNSKDLHFTNREVSAAGNSKYVLIENNAIIRLVYEPTTGEPDFKAAFYDYDISSGKIYENVNNAKSNSANGITNTGSQKNGTLYYAYTKEAGINSSGNYSGAGTKLSFGNVNTGTSLGENLWESNQGNQKVKNLLNKFNGTQGGHPSVPGSYKGCTFGLAEELVGGDGEGLEALRKGTIQYATNVNAPKLFNEGTATGKTNYDHDEYSLRFKRNGDTYTLTAVNNAGITGLEKFNHPSPYQGKVHTHIWTNNFWPMDAATSYGTDGHDIKFGSYDFRNNRAYAGSETTGEPGSKQGDKKTFPYSDDGQDHNSYFGMRYAVEFELSKEYVGPLEYYFFGDDDMWVFLDNTLVCDIGGVHSSVGEYVNLWDYLEKGSEGKHILTFFYTERGASGSTCWMQFTLPSATTLEPDKSDYGTLRVEKTVTQIDDGEESVVDNNDEFTFEIHFTDAAGNNLPDDYSYKKYRGEELIGSDLIIWDGGKFTLKNGEHIVVEYLPEGTRYKVTEANAALTITDNTSKESTVKYFTDITVNGNLEESKQDLADQKVATGNIVMGREDNVNFNNKFYTYSLPETGGNGSKTVYILAGALITLFGAGLVYRKKFRERRA